MQTSKEFLRIFLDMGEALLSSGAEIFRVEDTLNRMGYACGATQMNVFVITSSIVITMEFPGEGARTQTRRIIPFQQQSLRRNLMKLTYIKQNSCGNLWEAFWGHVVLLFFMAEVFWMLLQQDLALF